ncbi:hypothetical protein OAG36_00575 [bacterium]|nr:hypothetical protein [bacterium]
MASTIERVQSQLVLRAEMVSTEQTRAAAFDWGSIITLVMPLLLEMLMNCFGSSSKEALEQKLVNPTWWDKFWIARITRRAVREKKSDLGIDSRGRSTVANVLSAAIIEESQASPDLVSELLTETNDNNIPDYSDWI